MEKSWELFKEFDDGSICVKGKKAIKFTYGYSTGAELGAHNFLNSLLWQKLVAWIVMENFKPMYIYTIMPLIEKW